MSEQGEEVEQHIPVPLTKENIKSGLSQIGKTFDGTSVAFIKLNLENKELDLLILDLGNFVHLRQLSISGNHIEDISVLSSLTYLLKLEASGNKVNSLEIFNNSQHFRYLQHLDLSKNLIQQLSAIALPKLTHLKLSNNLVSTAHEFLGHHSLKVLELRSNKLTSLAGIHHLTALEELYLAENSINSLSGLQDLPCLKKIHLRKNTFSAFQSEGLPDLPSLAYLNIRENEFVEVGNLGLLQKYKNLAKIVISDNPVKAEPSGDVKKEVLVVLPQLKFLGKEEITAEEREDAVNEAAERKRLAEAAKIEAENAAKEALNVEHKEGEGEGEEVVDDQ